MIDGFSKVLAKTKVRSDREAPVASGGVRIAHYRLAASALKQIHRLRSPNPGWRRLVLCASILLAAARQTAGTRGA